ncbi:AURKA [Enterospora canceri]|uniref:AURKA n=1 Tax=Enterospora canceri TaxID=1081671 RepID=A0A1Y1S5B4_9MICR|nr:AURKA [Enterospora canceri]
MEQARKNRLIKTIVLVTFVTISLIFVTVVTTLLIIGHKKIKHVSSKKTTPKSTTTKAETPKPATPVDPDDLKHYSNFIIIAKKIEELINISDDEIMDYMETKKFNLEYIVHKTMIFVKDDLCLKISRPLISVIGKIDCETIKDLKHPNIIETYQYYTFITNKPDIEKQYVVDIMLTEKLSPFDKGKGDFKYIQMVMKDVLEGLAYLQTKRIVHCDIRVDNLMQKWDGTRNVIKIIDFDISIVLPKGETRTYTLLDINIENHVNAKHMYSGQMKGVFVTMFQVTFINIVLSFDAILLLILYLTKKYF